MPRCRIYIGESQDGPRYQELPDVKESDTEGAAYYTSVCMEMEDLHIEWR